MWKQLIIIIIIFFFLLSLFPCILEKKIESYWIAIAKEQGKRELKTILTSSNQRLGECVRSRHL